MPPTYLRISSDRLQVPKLDFAGLPSLVHLQRLAIPGGDPCTPVQVDALAACMALTELDVGYWTIESQDADLSGQTLSAKGRRQLSEGLAALVHRRKQNGATPLRSLNLRDALITPAFATHLLTLTELEKIDDARWSCALTEAHWNCLSQFSRLHTFYLSPADHVQLGPEPHRYAVLQLDWPLAALQHCTALTTLHLRGQLLLRSQHAAMLATIPRLTSLTLEQLHVESVEPLSRAPALTQLKLDGCCGVDGQPACMRSMVPALALLTRLSIENDATFPYGSADAIPVNAALLARVPLLNGCYRPSWKVESHEWDGDYH